MANALRSHKSLLSGKNDSTDATNTKGNVFRSDGNISLGDESGRRKRSTSLDKRTANEVADACSKFFPLYSIVRTPNNSSDLKRRCKLLVQYAEQGPIMPR